MFHLEPSPRSIEECFDILGELFGTMFIPNIPKCQLLFM
jgi:hypothetical protein